MASTDLAPLLAAVQRVLDETEREYARMPFFVRPIVRRGFDKRTGRDFAAWRALLASAGRGQLEAGLPTALRALAEHYRGAPARAQRGMGATAAELVEIEARSLARAETVMALHEAVAAALAN